MEFMIQIDLKHNIIKFGSCFNIILWQFDWIRCWFNPRFPLKYLLHTSHWVSFLIHLNDLYRCFSNSNSELNFSKQRLHKLLTLFAIVSFLLYAFLSKFVMLKLIFCESWPLSISSLSTEVSNLVVSLFHLSLQGTIGVFSLLFNLIISVNLNFKYPWQPNQNH